MLHKNNLCPRPVNNLQKHQVKYVYKYYSNTLIPVYIYKY